MSIDGSPPPPHLHAIFVDTSIDTHFAMSVSLHDTIGNVKAKIRAEHVLCFQEVGEISIQAIKVKRRGFFYILADSMYVSNAFDGVKGSWFLCTDVVSMCPVKDQEVAANEVMNAHEAEISPSEARKSSYPDGRGHHDTILTGIKNEHNPEMLIAQEKVKKRRKKTRNDLHELLGDHRRWSKFSKSHKIDESKKSPEISCGGKKFVVTSLGVQSRLTHKDDEVLQNSWIFEEQTKKRRRKSSNSHEEARLAMPSKTLLTRSPRENTLPHGSGKEAGISFFLGNIDESLPSDCRDVRGMTDSASLFDVANQKEKGALSMGTCTVIMPSINEEPTEDQILQVNPENRRQNNVKSALGTNIDKSVSQPNQISEDQGKTRRRRKNSNSGRSGLESPDINVVPLPKCKGEITEFDEGEESDQSNHTYVSNQNIEQHRVDAKTSIPLFEEDSPTLVKIPLMKSLGSCEEALDGPELIKEGNLTTTLSQGALEGPTMSKSDRIKSKNKVNVQSSSKISRHEIRSEDNNTLNFNFYFSPEQFRPQKSDTASSGSRTANVLISKNTKHLSDQDSSLGILEVDSSLQKANENPNIEKKPQNYVSQTLVQPSRDVEIEQGEKIIDTVASYDQSALYNGGDSSTKSNLVGDAVGLNNFVFSQSQGATDHVSSSESTEDMPQHLRRFRVVRKIPIRRQKRMPSISNPEILADENHNNEKKLQNYVSQKLVQPSGDVETKQGEKIIDTMASYDQCAQNNGGDASTKSNHVGDAVCLNNFDFSQSQSATNHVSSNESTEDTPQHLKRFRVVRKIPIRRQKRMANISNPEILADENHTTEKKLPNYVSQTLVQPSRDMEIQQGEKIIDTMASYDQCAQYNGGDPSTRSNLVGDAVGLNNFYCSQSPGTTNHMSSSESTDDTPQHLRRFRVVRKIPIRRQRRTNISNPEILADVNHNVEKKLSNYASRTLVQPSGDMETGQGEKIIDTMASHDQRAQYNEGDPSTRSNLVGDAIGLNNFDFSQSRGTTNHMSSSESTDDTPQHLRRFRVVRKIPIRRQKRMPNISNTEILLLDASSRNPVMHQVLSQSHLGEMLQRSVHL